MKPLRARVVELRSDVCPRDRQTRLPTRGPPRARDAYANGKTYYALDGRTIATPAMPDARPARELLEWHGDVVFRA